MDFDVSVVMQFGAVLVAIAGAFAVARWRVDAAERALAKLQTEHDVLEQHFNDYKVEAAEKYVTAAALGKFEQEIKGSLDRLSNRIDQALTPPRGRR